MPTHFCHDSRARWRLRCLQTQIPEHAAAQRVNGDTSSPDGVAPASIREHLGFQILRGIVFTPVNASSSYQRPPVYKCEHPSMHPLSASVFDNAAAQGYVSAKAID